MSGTTAEAEAAPTGAAVAVDDAALAEAAAFAGAAALQAPAHLAPSAWIEHVPFAFWIVDALRPRSLVELGTHHGTSYFAFCQEIRRLGLDARAHAVDTWKGDAHAGFYGEAVYEAVALYSRAHYAGFSTLHREEFAAALPRFPDGSVDLLHIDGLHSFEAVSADFEAWLPKLSRRGVVLLHDTRVRDRGFGVWRLVEALRSRYPLFEFAHGHGLAVVGVGPEQPPALQALLAAEASPPRKAAVERVFARLGLACRLEMERAAAPVADDTGRLARAEQAIRNLTAGNLDREMVAAITGSELFDAAWYGAQVPGLAESSFDPGRHYALFGAVLGLDPSPRFDSTWYLKTNPDVAAAGVNPLGHYLLYGRGEGRTMQNVSETHKAQMSNPISESGLTKQKRKIVGWIDQITDQSAIGWLYDPSEPTIRQRVEVYLKEQIIDTIVANEFRPKLRERGIGDGCYQFTFELPQGRYDREDLLFKHEGTKTTLRFSGRQPRPRHERFRHSFIYGNPEFKCQLSKARTDDNMEICARIVDAFHYTFKNDDLMRYDGMWDIITTSHHRALTNLVVTRDVKGLSEYLSGLHRTNAGHGITQIHSMTRELLANAEIRRDMARLYWDKLVSVAEIIGAVNFEDPVKLGRWGENLYMDAEDLREQIEREVKFEILVRNPSNDLFGIEIDGCVLDGRMIEAIYTGFRLGTFPSPYSKAIVEIGAGMGWSAYYAHKCGVYRYTIYDLPPLNILQSFNLLKTIAGDQVVLEEESHSGDTPLVHVKSAGRFFTDEFSLGQIFFNQDSFPEMGRINFHKYIREISKISRATLFSINQECGGESGSHEKQLVVKIEIAGYARYSRILRAPYWPRPGYVEEMYVVDEAEEGLRSV